MIKIPIDKKLPYFDFKFEDIISYNKFKAGCLGELNIGAKEINRYRNANSIFIEHQYIHSDDKYIIEISPTTSVPLNDKYRRAVRLLSSEMSPVVDVPIKVKFVNDWQYFNCSRLKCLCLALALAALSSKCS